VIRGTILNYELPSGYLKRLYYVTVSFNPLMLMMVRDMIDAHPMVMGSDYPHLLGSRDWASMKGLEISEEKKQRIFEGPALSILGDVKGLSAIWGDGCLSHYV